MISPLPGSRPSARRSPAPPTSFARLITAVFILAAGATPIRAQNIGTVRDNEFRSRWADYQVDRPQQTPGDTTAAPGSRRQFRRQHLHGY